MPVPVTRGCAPFGDTRRALPLIGAVILVCVAGVASCGRSLTSQPQGSGGGGSGGISLGGAGGGVAGHGGAGTDGMAGGAVTCPPAPFIPICDAALCGNGSRDSCQYPPIVDGPPPIFTEDCDGTELGGLSCQDFGYASGTLACLSSCWFDYSGCGDCLTAGPSVLSCGVPPISTTAPTSVAVAATDTEVGLAWIGSDAPDVGPAIHFARLSPELDLVSSAKLDDGCLAVGVAAAPLPSGWVIGVVTDTSVFIHAIDSTGKANGRTLIYTAPTGTLTFHGIRAQPMLVARPGGGPLMVWQDGSSLYATVVAADGRSTTTVLDLPTDGITNGWDLSGAFVVDAFYVAFAASDELRLVRVAADGSAAAVADGLPGESLGQVSLAAGADDLRIVYRSYPNLYWRRVDSLGIPLSPPVVVARSEEYVGMSPAVAIGDDTVILVAGLARFSQGALGIARVGPTGTMATPVYHIVSTQFVTWYDITRRGPDIIVVWQSGNLVGQLGIARIKP